MDAKTLVASWIAEKQHYLNSLQESPSSSAAARLHALALPADQQAQVVELLDCALTDQLYTLLLGLDGAASIGGQQHDFALYNEAGQALTGSGELEAEAYAQLHERQT
ncbi:hypothetical protein GV819_11705 [Pseudomonas sp. Fl5BN2]|uniref:hypothetical protein n=1 Tax=unclassified Pseudomonas TaxID=196821 RepID=UPI0013774628|nr:MULTISPECIES: hypothetical protein [unclassified Pseudomonas]NBF02953.1 hypothetical protein [Pseudomonas sp. Fl5BN2]NBF11705.1 hypothetical protein [Pseudomonas sp. Fl4BN1]